MKQCENHGGGKVVVTWSDGPENCPMCELIAELETTKKSVAGPLNILDRLKQDVDERLIAWEAARSKAADIPDLRRVGEAAAVAKELRSVKAILGGA